MKEKHGNSKVWWPKLMVCHAVNSAFHCDLAILKPATRNKMRTFAKLEEAEENIKNS